MYKVKQVNLRPGDHGSTYGGNPLASAIGIVATQIIIDEKLPENALEQGNFIKENLLSISQKYGFMKEIRGRGLFLSMV